MHVYISIGRLAQSKGNIMATIQKKKMTKSCQILSEVGKHVVQMKWLSLCATAIEWGSGLIHALFYGISNMMIFTLNSVPNNFLFDTFPFRFIEIDFSFLFSFIFMLGGCSVNGTARFDFSRPASLSFNCTVDKEDDGANKRWKRRTNVLANVIKDVLILFLFFFLTLPVKMMYFSFLSLVFFHFNFFLISCTHFLMLFIAFSICIFMKRKRKKTSAKIKAYTWVKQEQHQQRNRNECKEDLIFCVNSEKIFINNFKLNLFSLTFQTLWHGSYKEFRL